jgi:hypothetical protein
MSRLTVIPLGEGKRPADQPLFVGHVLRKRLARCRRAGTRTNFEPAVLP